jgi:patatin-like phospholipase/acyl hydrolase
LANFCILSFCGGGIRGLLSSGYLNRLNKYAKENGIDLIKNTNMFAGTSTGADIISLLMAGIPPELVYATYRGVSIKGKELGAPATFEFTSFNPMLPAYDVAGLVKAQEFLHGDKKINDYTKHSLLFTSFHVGSDLVPWRPVLFNNLANPTYNDGNHRIADAVAGSSSMPGMYGSVKGHVDGAFVSHDPTLAAISLAVANGVSLSDIRVICFGTGLMSNWIASDTANWGAQQWQQGDGNPKNRVPKLLINGTVSPILNMTMDGTSTSLTQDMSAMLLGSNYAYVNSKLEVDIAENDINPEALKYMELCVDGADMSQAEAVVRAWA